jgi:hypothetical protein
MLKGLNVIKNCVGNPEIFKMLKMLDLQKFNSTYLSLSTFLTRVRRSTHTEIVYATPPAQTTVPDDPNRSGGSTLSSSSSSSTVSKPEPYAQNVATNFLTTTYSTVSEWMGHIDWVNPETKLYLYLQYVNTVFF